jgi:hypothetical protein
MIANRLVSASLVVCLFMTFFLLALTAQATAAVTRQSSTTVVRSNGCPNGTCTTSTTTKTRRSWRRGR